MTTPLYTQVNITLAGFQFDALVTEEVAARLRAERDRRDLEHAENDPAGYWRGEIVGVVE